MRIIYCWSTRGNVAVSIKWKYCFYNAQKTGSYKRGMNFLDFLDYRLVRLIQYCSQFKYCLFITWMQWNLNPWDVNKYRTSTWSFLTQVHQSWTLWIPSTVFVDTVPSIFGTGFPFKMHCHVWETLISKETNPHPVNYAWKNLFITNFFNILWSLKIILLSVLRTSSR